MNFLAHIFLSGQQEELMIGNFIADFVRGNQMNAYSPGIIEGIQLHRKIDAFTDAHPAVRQSVDRLRPLYGRYAAVLVDIFYDHFLALNWNRYAVTDIETFCSRTYRVFEQNAHLMPESVQSFLPHMISDNWLFHYGNFYGMERALHSIGARARFQSDLHAALQQLRQEHGLYNRDFQAFFPELVAFVEAERRG